MHFSRLKKSLEWVVVLVVLAAGLPLYAQTGQLSGKCTDEQGKALVGYNILIERIEIKGTYKTKTDKQGEYTYLGLPTGPYKVTLQSPIGQTIYTTSGVVITFGDTIQHDFDMAKQKAYEAQREQEELKANPELQKMKEKQSEEAKTVRQLERDV